MKTRNRLMLEHIIKEIITEIQQNVFEPTEEGTGAFINLLKSKIKTPYVHADTGFRGSGYEKIYLTVGLDNKEDYPHQIFENSRYFKMQISPDGTIYEFTQNLRDEHFNSTPLKFRKTKAKNANDVILKIQQYIKQINDYYNNMDDVLKPIYLKNP